MEKCTIFMKNISQGTWQDCLKCIWNSKEYIRHAEGRILQENSDTT